MKLVCFLLRDFTAGSGVRSARGDHSWLFFAKHGVVHPPVDTQFFGFVHYAIDDSNLKRKPLDANELHLVIAGDRRIIGKLARGLIDRVAQLLRNCLFAVHVVSPNRLGQTAA